jgi:hypothetical protein
MTARSAPQVVSSRIRERQTAASTASMPSTRPRRRGQAPKPHRGAPKAQGLTAAIAVAGPSPVPSIAPDDPVSLNSTGADVPMAFATLRIYTSLTDTTSSCALLSAARRRFTAGNHADAAISPVLSRFTRCTVPLPTPTIAATLSTPCPALNRSRFAASTLAGTLGRPSFFALRPDAVQPRVDPAPNDFPLLLAEHRCHLNHRTAHSVWCCR